MSMMPADKAFLPTPEQLKTLQVLQAQKGTLAIAEVAGRDSVAAMVAHSKLHPDVIFVPTIVTTGTEYGDTNAPLDAISYTRQLLPEIEILEPVYLFSPELWSALNGRFASVLTQRYPGWSPCASCHLYLHLMRAPLCFALQAPLVTGERDTHQGRYKLSQTPEMIQMFITLLCEYGILLYEPLRYMHENDRIETLVGAGWDEGARQMQCVHSGSFKDVHGDFTYDAAQWQRYLDEFAEPAARIVLDALQKGSFNEDWNLLIGSLFV